MTDRREQEPDDTRPAAGPDREGAGGNVQSPTGRWRREFRLRAAAREHLRHRPGRYGTGVPRTDHEGTMSEADLIDTAHADFVAAFVRACVLPLEADALAKLDEVFEMSAGNALRRGTVNWERRRPFVLARVEEIAVLTRFDVLAGGGPSVTGEVLKRNADRVVGFWRERCDDGRSEVAGESERPLFTVCEGFRMG